MVAWDLCKVFVRVRFSYPPPRANKNLALQALLQCLLVSMGDIETYTNKSSRD